MISQEKAEHLVCNHPEPKFETRGWIDRPEPFDWNLLAPMVFLVFLIAIIVFV